MEYTVEARIQTVDPISKEDYKNLAVNFHSMGMTILHHSTAEDSSHDKIVVALSIGFKAAPSLAFQAIEELSKTWLLLFLKVTHPLHPFH